MLSRRSSTERPVTDKTKLRQMKTSFNHAMTWFGVTCGQTNRKKKILLLLLEIDRDKSSMAQSFMVHLLDPKDPIVLPIMCVIHITWRWERQSCEQLNKEWRTSNWIDTPSSKTLDNSRTFSHAWSLLIDSRTLTPLLIDNWTNDRDTITHGDPIGMVIIWTSSSTLFWINSKLPKP
jgi:hypothetical protein